MKKKFFTKFLMVIAMLFGLVVTGGNLNEVNAAEVTIASKTVSALITEYGWTSSTTKQSFKLDTNVSVKINGGSNTGKAYDGNHIRIYATDSPAGTITISVADGYELDYVTISTQTGTYAFLRVNGTTTDISNTKTKVSGTSVVLNSVKNGSNGKQVRVTKFEVGYVSADAACEHTNTTTTNDATCTMPGTEKVSCIDCGIVLSETPVDALGHDYDASGTCQRCATTVDYNVALLFEKYYNNGLYTKDTVLNVNKIAKEEVGIYFHAEADTKYRRTVYEPGSVSMVTSEDGKTYDNATLSKYVDDGGSVKHTGLGGEWSVNWESVETKFVTLNDFKVSTLTGWTYENGSYTYYLTETTATEEHEMTTMAREFVAPMWLAPNSTNYNYAIFNKLVVEEVDDALVMKLCVKGTNSGILLEDFQESLVFSQATITQGSKDLSILATFEFGANGSALHEDGDEASTYSDTQNKLTLNISGGNKMYTGAKDAKGNSCIKFGTGKAAGEMSLTVPNGVTKVIINVAGYKGDAAKISINGGAAQTINTLSDNGEYTAIEVDTSVNKTVTFATLSGGFRCMVNSIEFH